ncbi:MAG: hypothetical protein HFG54_10120 [Lachnospiraceae bacterium]|jgi:hypothetical protein|nr:hypothetical protein [Lachnospiraceae bacterium]
MAGAQEREIRKYVLKKDRIEKVSVRYTELGDMAREEIMAAVRMYGEETVIKEYRDLKAEPPVDILLAYLYQKPEDITQYESELLKKAYGWGFIGDVYRQLGVKDPYEISTWGKIKGWFGRKFNAYQKVSKFEHHTMSGAPSGKQESGKGNIDGSRLKQTGNQLFQEIKKMESGGEVKDNPALITQADQSVDSLNRLEGMESGKDWEQSEGMEPGKGLESSEGMEPGKGLEQSEGMEPGKDSGQSERTEPGEALEGRFIPAVNGQDMEMPGRSLDGETDREPLHAIDRDQTEDGMDYKGYIRLHGYQGYGFEEGLMQYRSQDVSVLLPGGLAYGLKNTDFTLTYDSKADGGVAVMQRGEAELLLGVLKLYASGMKYSDFSDTFLAEQAGIQIDGGSFFSLQTSAALGNLRISRFGLSFDEFTAEIKEFSLFDGGLTVQNPKFHMMKTDKWRKDISIGGLSVTTSFLSLDLSSEEDGSWMFKEEDGDTPEVAGDQTKWTPYISGGTAHLTVGELFEQSMSDISLDQQRMQAKETEVKLNLKLPGNKLMEADARIQDLQYEFGGSGLSWKNMDGKGTIPVGDTTLPVTFDKVAYNQAGGLTIGLLKGTMPIADKEVTLEGTDIAYSKETGFDFGKISGTVKGDMAIGPALTLKHIGVSLEKGGADYAVTLSGGAEALTGNFALQAQASVKVSKDGLDEGLIKDAHLNIRQEMITGDMKEISFSGQEKTLSMKEAELKIQMPKGEKGEFYAENFSYQYESGTVSLQNAKAAGNFFIGGLGIDSQMEDMAYENEILSIGKLTGDLTVENHGFHVEGDKIQYETVEKGFDFERLSGSSGQALEVGTGLKLVKAGIEISRQASEGEMGEEGAKSPYTVSLWAGVEAKYGKFSLLAEETRITVSENVIHHVQIQNAELDMDNQTVYGKIREALYSKAEGSFQFSGNLAFHVGDISLSGEVTDGKYDADGLFIQSAEGTIHVLKKDIRLLGEELSYTRENGFGFKRLYGELSEDLTLFPGFSLTGISVDITKEPSDQEVQGEKAGQSAPDFVSAVLSAGVKGEIPHVLLLSADKAGFLVAKEGLQDGKIQGASLDIKDGLIHGESEEIAFSFHNKEVSASNLKFSAGGGSPEGIEALSNVLDFLKEASITVGKVSYKEGTGLTYEGFQFHPAKISIGTEPLGLDVDFGENQVEGHLKWDYPEGMGAEGGGDAPEILSIEAHVPILPGLALGGGIGFGAGLSVGGSLAVKREGKQEPESIYGLKGEAFLNANAWVGAKLNLVLGDDKLAALKAGIAAKLGLDMKSMSGLEVKIHHTGAQIKVQEGKITYNLSALAEFKLTGYISAKLLFFKERTLCQKELGVWELGKMELSGGASWDGQKLNLEEVKKSIRIGGKELADGSLDDRPVTSTDKAIAALTDTQAEESLHKLLGLEEERRKAEAALLDENALWEAGGNEAAQAVVSQVGKLAELYEQNLTLLSERIRILTEQSSQALIGTGESYVDIQLSRDVAERTYKLADRMARETEGRKDKPLGGFEDIIKETKHLYRKSYRQVYLNYVSRLMETIIGQNEGYFKKLLEEIPGKSEGKPKKKKTSEEKAAEEKAKAWKAAAKDCQGAREDLKQYLPGLDEKEADQAKERLSARKGEMAIKEIWKRCQGITGWEEASQANGRTEHGQIITNLLETLQSRYDLEAAMRPYLYTEGAYRQAFGAERMTPEQLAQIDAQRKRDEETAGTKAGAG